MEGEAQLENFRTMLKTSQKDSFTSRDEIYSSVEGTLDLLDPEATQSASKRKRRELSHNGKDYVFTVGRFRCFVVAPMQRNSEPKALKACRSDSAR